MAALDTATVNVLHQALHAYIAAYGGGESVTALRAIAGALLSAQIRAGELVAQGLALEAWVDGLVEAFRAGEATTAVRDAGAAAIASRAKVWRDGLEAKASATLDAYIQTYRPNLTTAKLQEIVTTVLPVVEDAKIARDEAFRLIGVISKQFDASAALGRELDRTWLPLARQVHDSIANRDVASAVQDVVQAYIAKFTPALTEIGEGLIEDALQAVMNSRQLLKLDVDIDLGIEAERLLIRQVSFNLELMQAAPAPSKTAVEIAQQLHQEIDRYRRQRAEDFSTLPQIKRTDEVTGASTLGGDMSIGIQIKPDPKVSRPPQPPGERSENRKN